jgi:hypothetical protein
MNPNSFTYLRYNDHEVLIVFSEYDTILQGLPGKV